MSNKHRERIEADIDQRRDNILRTMLQTPPQPNWRPKNVRKTKKKRSNNAPRSR